MSKRYVVPDPEAVEKILEIIFGEDLTVSEHTPSDFSGKHIARFIDREDKWVATAICDKPFVGYSGGALSMIPSGTVDDMISDDELTDALLGNFYEVMNICSKLMMSDYSEHLRLEKTFPPGQLAEEIATMAAESTKVGFEIDIPGYGKGTMDLLIA